MKSSLAKLSAKEIAGLMGVLIFFIGMAFFATRYGDFFKEIPYFKGYQGVFLFFLVTLIAVVAAPLSTLPLMPLAVTLWGSFMAAVLSIAGWTVGAAIAFGLARRYGKPLIQKIMPFEKIRHIEKRIPERRIFFSIVLLRMALPVDVLSYALGLFSIVPFSVYILATLIGVTPFAFFFAYAATFPIALQGLFVLLVIIILMLGYRRVDKVK